MAKENYSRKRMAILRALNDTDIHPTAEWVYTELKSKYPDLSLGTVYRNLKKFCTDGVIKSVGVVKGQERFDGNTQEHSHFVCQICGSVIDIKETFVSENEIGILSRLYEVEINQATSVFKGVCRECKNEKGKEVS